MHVEDHPLEYLDFEGTIPKGEYGAGDSICWDWGTFQAEETWDPAEAVERGELKLRLWGEKLVGRWTLVHTGGRSRGGAAGHGSRSDADWLLIAKRGPDAVEGWDADDFPASVKSGLTNEEVAAGAKPRISGSPPAPLATLDPPGARLVGAAGVPPADARHAGDGALRRPGLGLRAEVGRLPAPGDRLGREGNPADAQRRGRRGVRPGAARTADVARGAGGDRRRRARRPRPGRAAGLRAAPGRWGLGRSRDARLHGVRPAVVRRPLVPRRRARGPQGGAAARAPRPPARPVRVAPRPGRGRVFRGRAGAGARGRDGEAPPEPLHAREAVDLVAQAQGPPRPRSSSSAATSASAAGAGISARSWWASWTTAGCATRVGSAAGWMPRRAGDCRRSSTRARDRTIRSRSPPAASPAPRASRGRSRSSSSGRRSPAGHATGWCGSPRSTRRRPDVDPATVERQVAVGPGAARDAVATVDGAGSAGTAGDTPAPGAAAGGAAAAAAGTRRRARRAEAPAEHTGAGPAVAFAPPTAAELAALAALPARGGTWTIAGRDVKLTNLDRVLAPGRPQAPPGARLAGHPGAAAAATTASRRTSRHHQARPRPLLRRIAPVLLPHLAGRALNLDPPPRRHRPALVLAARASAASAPAWLTRGASPTRPTGRRTRTSSRRRRRRSPGWGTWPPVELHPWTSLDRRARTSRARPSSTSTRGPRPRGRRRSPSPGSSGGRSTISGSSGSRRSPASAASRSSSPCARATRSRRPATGWSASPGRSGRPCPTSSAGSGRRIAATAARASTSRRTGGTARSWRPTRRAPPPGLPVSAPIAWDELDDPDAPAGRWTVRTIVERVESAATCSPAALGPGQSLPRL